MSRTPRVTACFALAAVVAIVALPGCSMHFGWSRPNVWLQESERFDLAAADLDRLELKTRNGAVHVRAGADGDATVHVTAIKRAGGDDEAEARAALARLDVERRVSGGCLALVGDWEDRQRSDGSSSIAFEIELPARLDLRIDSRNGEITVEGTQGTIALVSHNGRLDVDAPARRVSAKTHNGAIAYRGPGEEVAIETHNGRVQAVLTGGPVNGRIETRNGAVDVQAASGVRGTLAGETRNGGVSVRASSVRCRIRDDSFVVEFPDPSTGRLEVETSNGAIVVR